MRRILQLLLLLFCITFVSCKNRSTADLIVHNALVYSVDSTFRTYEAFAVKDGKFIGTGTSADILAKYESDSVIDAGGKPVYPGFIDPHSHFLGLGKLFDEADLTGTESFSEIIERLNVQA